MDEIREFDNKLVKELLRRNHRSEGDLAPELELAQQWNQVTQAFVSAFHTLDSSSGGAVPKLPGCDVVKDIAARAQWPSMMHPLLEPVALKQTPFFDASGNVQMVKETLASLFREHQFH